MKKIFLVLIVLIGISKAADSGGIEILQDYHYVSTGTGAGLYFARWHDKQSGVEFICAENSRWNNDAGVSCFPTGRSWK